MQDAGPSVKRGETLPRGRGGDVGNNYPANSIGKATAGQLLRHCILGRSLCRDEDHIVLPLALLLSKSSPRSGSTATLVEPSGTTRVLARTK